MMKTLLIHTPENYTSVSSLTEKKAVQESMEKHETSYFETSVLTMPENALCGFFF